MAWKAAAAAAGLADAPAGETDSSVLGKRKEADDSIDIDEI
jgi:hypothetical protein